LIALKTSINFQSKGRPPRKAVFRKPLARSVKLPSHFKDIREKSNLSVPSDKLQVTLTDTQNTSRTSPKQGTSSGFKGRLAWSRTAPVLMPVSVDKEYQSLCTNVNASWAKLSKYHLLTDLSSAYVAAVVLHPAYT
jgi:hypothetical protein